MNYKCRKAVYRTYRFGVEFGHFMTCVIDEHVRPTTFLVNDAGEIARIVLKWSKRFLGEAPDAAEGRILYNITYVSIQYNCRVLR